MEYPPKKPKLDTENQDVCPVSKSELETTDLRFCPYCRDKAFTNGENLIEHLKSHGSNVTPPLFCMFCRVPFRGSGFDPKEPVYDPQRKIKLHRQHRKWHVMSGHVLPEDLKILKLFLTMNDIESLEAFMKNARKKGKKRCMIAASKKKFPLAKRRISDQSKISLILDDNIPTTSNNVSTAANNYEGECKKQSNNVPTTLVLQPITPNVQCPRCKINFSSVGNFIIHLEENLDESFSMQGHIDHFLVPISGFFCKLCQVFYSNHDNITPNEHFKSDTHKINLKYLKSVYDEVF